MKNFARHMMDVAASADSPDFPPSPASDELAQDIERKAAEAALNVREVGDEFGSDDAHMMIAELLRLAERAHRAAGNATRANTVGRQADHYERRAAEVRGNRQRLFENAATIGIDMRDASRASYELADAFRFLCAQGQKTALIRNVFQTLLLVAILAVAASRCR